MSRTPEHFTSAQRQKVTRASLSYAWARTVQRFSDERLTNSASSLSFFFLLALVPALGAAISTISVFGQGPTTVTSLLTWATQVTNSDAVMALHDPLLTLARSPANTVVFVVGVLVSLWSAGKYVSAFGTVVNTLYNIPEGRPWWALRLRSFGLTILLIPLATAAVVCLAGQQEIVESFGIAEPWLTVWSVGRIIFAVILGYLVIIVLNSLSSNVRRKSLASGSFGSLVSLVAAVVLTAGLYVFGITVGFGSGYGALTGVLLALLWLWLLNGGLIFGALFEAELDRARQLQAGMDSTWNIQAQPRWRKRIEDASARELGFVRMGSVLRETAGRSVGNVRINDFRATNAIRRRKRRRRMASRKRR